MIRIFVWDFYKQFEPITITMKILNYYKYLSVFTLLFGPLSFAQHQFEVKDASKNYDIIISVENCFDDQCKDKGTVELFDNKNTRVQTFTSGNLIFYFDKGQKPKPGQMFQVTREQSPAIFGDFNFDGLEDIAIRNGNNGNYSGASYDVYLFNNTKMGFVKSKELTDLASNFLDLFEIDSEHKRLVTHGKSGCCILYTTGYKVIANQELDKVYEKQEDFTAENEVKVMIEEKINNRWSTKIKKYPKEQYNKEK
ncbi:XAC2610-related protein [Chryseobacterium sp. PMSZPI]|uniref:XAC2610-related protein n=1 Tax=Chryseobacterium sp. PMSZPI TaxID=1033900 RepID=UPI000C347902|nr:FG-GAP repeat protein [Chryseobacterium sp. PMSZPI]PKF74140.1 hypothetical protein CW752_11265 [Chryseobacterium sp. PMSZPI]